MTLTRREWICGAAALPLTARAAPSAPVAVARCNSYEKELEPVLGRMFDQLGGLGRLVRNKTVAIKLNLTGPPSQRLGRSPVGSTHWVHDRMIAATLYHLGRAGARRIRLLESPATVEPLPEHVLQAGWVPEDFASAASGVEFENTTWLGSRARYTRLKVPGRGHVFPAFDLNPAYEECDVFVSLTKLKEHYHAGITLSMKNVFGITPLTIYGDGSPQDRPGDRPRGGRGMLHRGQRQPPASAPPENDPGTPREDGYRLPRIVADLCAARPIHLALIDGIDTMAGGEGPWIKGSRFVHPGVLVAGTNCVSTDAVAAAIMGFDPSATRGTPPFEKCDNTMLLGEAHGLGACRLDQIEVRGTPVKDVRFDFRKA
ncbi:MAG: DUF362 domain-containing protein [Bryobacterales bacterium]|nr:DUF362 domain-containing protein [Bryobacterales bacterium]